MWGSSYHNLLHAVGTWIKDIELHLTSLGSFTAELLEERLSRLLQNNYLFIVVLGNQCLDYYRGESYGQNFVYKDMLVDELVMDWIGPLLENLKYLIHLNDLNLLGVSKRLIKELEEKLLSMRNFLEFAGKEFQMTDGITTMNGLMHVRSEDILTRVKFLIENAVYLSYKLWMQRKIFSMDKFVYDLLVKMNHIEPEIKMLSAQSLRASRRAYLGTLGIDFQAFVSVDSLLCILEEQKDVYSGSILPLDSQQQASLQKELIFLRYFLIDPHLKQCTKLEPECFNSFLMQIEAVARESASVLARPFCDDQKKDETVNEMNLMHLNLLQMVDLLKAKTRQIYTRVLEPLPSKFPQIPELGFLKFFIQSLEELVMQRVDSIAYAKNEIETVLREFSSLHSFIKYTIIQPEEDKNITTRVVDLAYEAERVIDLILASHFPRWSYMCWLSDVIEKIKALREESTHVWPNMTRNMNVINVEKAFTENHPPGALSIAVEEDMVGFNDQAEIVIERLTTGPKDLDIVTIFGMPGLGKTTLAKKVYEHPSVTKHFHVRSWYCISQMYDIRELLLSILGNVTELTKEIREMNEEGMTEVLYRSLKGKRYLIFIDDIWSIDPWHKLHLSFPDDHKGSRILFTTRIEEVSEQANSKSPPHVLRLFTEEESWQLLQKRVFRQKSCPPKLHAIGKKIAESCKRLPLYVVVIAGVLARLEQTEDQWKQVLESLRQVVDDSNEFTNVLELSYNHLPDHLKPCFLYLGTFPEDEEIPTWKLKRLWMAEGLIQKTEAESLENVAEDYLTNLIARSLVLIAQNKSRGGVKSCHVHDLLKEFSLKKAKEENFMLVSQEMMSLEQYRHCLYGKQDYLHGWMPKESYARSVFLFPNENLSLNLSVLPYVLKLLRVLDLERITLSCHKYPIEVELLVHLRYLAIRGQLDLVPASVGNLWRLETFIVKGAKGEVKLPETLLKMAYLKHLWVNEQAAFELSEKSFSSASLEKLSTLSIRHGDGTMEEVIRRLKSLRKLKCIISESLDYQQFQPLDFPSKMESVNLTYQGRVRRPCDFNFPSNLKKLTLSKFRLPWSEMAKIGKLPQLEVLKLLFRAFEGKKWEVSSDEFCKLKLLKMESLDIEEWYVCENAFRSLGKLVLQSCKQFKKITSSFSELDTLKMIEVKWCSYSACKAVDEIQQEQNDLIAGGLKVMFQPVDWNSQPSS